MYHCLLVCLSFFLFVCLSFFLYVHLSFLFVHLSFFSFFLFFFFFFRAWPWRMSDLVWSLLTFADAFSLHCIVLIRIFTSFSECICKIKAQKMISTRLSHVTDVASIWQKFFNTFHVALVQGHCFQTYIIINGLTNHIRVFSNQSNNQMQSIENSAIWDNFPLA